MIADAILFASLKPHPFSYIVANSFATLIIISEQYSQSRVVVNYITSIER